MKIASKLFA